MFGFNGDFRQRPIQSLRGASQNEQRENLLKRAQEERQKRESARKQVASATKIQCYFRGFYSRKILKAQLRAEFDRRIKGDKNLTDKDNLQWCISKIVLFFNENLDGERMVTTCQVVIKQRDQYMAGLRSNAQLFLSQIKSLLTVVLKYLDSIADTSAAIAIPMRMLEIFLSPDSYRVFTEVDSTAGQKMTSQLLQSLVNRGYFSTLRKLLNFRVPASMEKTSVPPTPVAASIFDLIMSPVSFAVSTSDKSFREDILRKLTTSFLCERYSEQVALFLLPAMAYGKYPFPFVELIHTLVQATTNNNKSSDSASTPQTSHKHGMASTTGKHSANCSSTGSVEDTPWLLASILMLANKELANLDVKTCALYLRLLKRLLVQLPSVNKSQGALEDSDDDEDEEDMDADMTSLSALHSECLRLLDSEAHLKCVYSCVMSLPAHDYVHSVAAIAHSLLIRQKMALHKIRLLYILAFNAPFMKNLWNACLQVSVPTVTRSSTSLLSMLSEGIGMSEDNIQLIVPLLSTFCCLFNHSLLSIYDADFYGETQAELSSMPFSVSEMVPMCRSLRDCCLGIIELAHPDSRVAMSSDYIEALQKTGALNKTGNDSDLAEQTKLWEYIFKVISTLIKQLHSRDSRRPFCPFGHWLAPNVNIPTHRPSQIYSASNAIFVRRDFSSLSSLTKANTDTDAPPLANRDVRNLVILTQLPFVVPFLDRVKILQNLISVDKQDNQGQQQDFGLGPSIVINIRRNFIYEDAFEKLSRENEPNLKKKMRVSLLNFAGLDEAGIDGGGLFREFLSELLKTGFDPNRGFFKYTADRLLYPNPDCASLVENFTLHFYFLGRVLGKALQENLLVEIPFASFFLSKILSPQNTSLDINHLQSMDPLVYKNLLYLKHYEGDVGDLGLDFTVVNNQFGETQVVDLKPGGSNITVTDSNKIEYVHLMADYRINKQIRSHCNAFREGLNDVLPLEWLQMFNSVELQVLISGASVPIDLADLRQNTKYSGEYTDSHPVIETFWSVLNDFTDQQKRQLLKFVTSCSRPPLLGFRDLYPAFCIHSAGQEVDRLPTASTCMNLLKLPAFQDAAALRSKLLYALESGAGFELS